MQRVRQFEKDRIYEEYKDLVGDIVTGTVRRRERGDLMVELGKAEALLPPRECIPGENYAPGERIRCLLLNIENTTRGPEIILSRASIKFVRRLFELEVAEITDGTVIIEAMAREPGYRTKISVNTKDQKVDPVGACVGARGARVKSIVRELGGEKIDIIRYYADPQRMLEEAIRPAVPKNVRVDERNRRIYFEVAEKDLATAIGRGGQNAKLTSRLMGWKLDISREKQEALGFEERKQKAIAGHRARAGGYRGAGEPPGGDGHQLAGGFRGCEHGGPGGRRFHGRGSERPDEPLGGRAGELADHTDGRLSFAQQIFFQKTPFILSSFD